MIETVSTGPTGQSAKRYRFGSFSLDPAQHRLTKDGEAVAVEPKVFDLLRLLVENAGQLITRDRMIEVVWQGRIVSDSAISACVAAARRAVEDDGQTQAVIKTVARRGFTCVADVEVAGTKPVPQRQLAPRLQFTKNREGKSLAYALVGDGPPIVYTTFGSTSIEADWSSPFFRPLFDAISAQNTLVRFDGIGSGHSDLLMASAGPEAGAKDLLAVADAVGLDRFGLFCQSGSALSAVYLAAHYPDRISRMVLNGGYALGRDLRDGTSGTQEMFGMISEAWDKPQSSFLLAYSLLYFPEGPLDLAKDIVEIMNKACPAENMLKMRKAFNNASVVDLLPKVQCPTLIVHARNDSIHPLSQARMLATGIPNSELLVLESANHVPMPGSADWSGFVASTIDFLNS
ncbi:MAG: alpha/beta fold hydrolase [Pseudomonadota bacterium]